MSLAAAPDQAAAGGWGTVVVLGLIAVSVVIFLLMKRSLGRVPTSFDDDESAE